MRSMHVKIKYFEDVLGTASSNPDIHSEFIASKAPDAESREEEIARLGVEAVNEKGTTIFPKTIDGRPFLYDYQIKGFFKEACGMLRRASGMRSKKLTAYKKVIDGIIFVMPRIIPFNMPEGTEITLCERPLRASTPQGERVALASSEQIPRGSTQEFDVLFMNDDLEPLIREWLAYGQLHGIGQWRNSGKGRFTYECSASKNVKDIPRLAYNPCPV